jgi:ribosome biogenesis GTPase / thiamine phosphate phosphatase
MIEFSFESLRGLGLSQSMARTLAAWEGPDGGTHRWVRVTAVHRETLEVHDGVRPVQARALPRLTRELLEQGGALTVGDWVLCHDDAHGQCWVTQCAPALTRIVRRDADGSRHTVVSNVDTALLVMGLDLDFNLQRLERYLALVGSSGVLPVVVLTKADIAERAGATAVSDRIEALRQRVGNSVDVLALDARDPAIVDPLRAYLGPGQTVVLLGSSGAGKSTLTNTLAGHVIQDTGAVREHDSRGKHTTTARSLHQLPSGACVIDTPGVRTLRPDVDAETLGQLFGDVAALSGECRFRDCQHVDEPGCAVRAHVSAQRLRNFHKLLREARRDTLSALERQRQLAEWKARGRAGRQRLELKRARTRDG